MNNTELFLFPVALACLAVAVAGSGDHGRAASSAHTVAVHAAPRTASGELHLCLTSDLLGANVVSSQGDRIGKIDDIVVHPGGVVAHAVVSTGGIVGHGEHLFLVPWDALSCADLSVGIKDKDPNNDRDDLGLNTRDKSRDRVVLSVNSDRLKNSLRYEGVHWLEVPSEDWVDRADAYSCKSGRVLERRRTLEADVRSSSIVYKLGELDGADVRDPAGAKLGDIEDVAIDTEGLVSFAIVSVGGVLGIGEKRVAVPWDALTLTREGDKGELRVTLASTKSRLKEAPRVPSIRDDYGAMEDPVWLGRVYAHASIEPYWTTGWTAVDARERDAEMNRDSEHERDAENDGDQR